MNTHAPSQAVCEVAKVKVQVKDRGRRPTIQVVRF